ncbi:Protein T2 [Lathyrus oleraceus]|uniref:YTH domain-containing family protein n=2 Tax=Pisum sativum TaxID=3888 RepID=A0A9D5B937_PEA|nr:Protein T2 [Pisum sativum]
MKRNRRLLIFQTVSNTTRLIFQKNTQEVQQKPGGCPICLLFSVNTSWQFVGLAEMIGPVDFNRSLDYWQQDKWNGCFPLKWHIVKDVPNNVLRHIILLNNENKPVTNSRDTQEVLLEPCLKLIKLFFKEYPSKTCILDDFGFYEGRQKTLSCLRSLPP